eukprot:1122588-Prymnesium_polylepis.1
MRHRPLRPPHPALGSRTPGHCTQNSTSTTAEDAAQHRIHWSLQCTSTRDATRTSTPEQPGSRVYQLCADDAVRARAEGCAQVCCPCGAVCVDAGQAIPHPAAADGRLAGVRRICLLELDVGGSTLLLTLPALTLGLAPRFGRVTCESLMTH